MSDENIDLNKLPPILLHYQYRRNNKKIPLGSPNTPGRQSMKSSVVPCMGCARGQGSLRKAGLAGGALWGRAPRAELVLAACPI